jgi:hypothetical protein
MTWVALVQGVTLSNIASVEIHLPEEKTFHHVRVRYPDRPVRAYPEVNDKLAAAVGFKIFTNAPGAPLQGPMPGGYTFTNSAQALAAIDVLRGSQLVQSAWRSISSAKPAIEFGKLPVKQLERIRIAAEMWKEADDPEVRRCGEELQKVLENAK